MSMRGLLPDLDTELDDGWGDLDLPHEYIAVHFPRPLCKIPWYKTSRGYEHWELFTMEEFDSGARSGDIRPGWARAGGACVSLEWITDWVQDLLGFPVEATPGDIEVAVIKTGRTFVLPVWAIRRDS